MMKLPPTELSQADVATAMQDAANLFAAAIALIDGTWQHSEDRDASEQAKHRVVDLISGEIVRQGKEDYS
jgi:hypothetical protein